MKFDGPELEELEIALYDAFPDDSSFNRMLTHGFGSSAAARLGSARYADRALVVLEWAGARDRHDQLVRVARRANLDNPKLRAFEKKIGTSIRTEDLRDLERLLVTEALELQHVLDVGRSFDAVLWSPLVEIEDVRTAFRRNVDRLASMPQQPDGSLPLYTFATELAALLGRENVVHEWMKSLGIGAVPRVRLAARPSNQANWSRDPFGARVLERIVKQSRALQHISTLRRAMERAEYQVCRILTESGTGTGFLVARDVVLYLPACHRRYHPGRAHTGVRLQGAWSRSAAHAGTQVRGAIHPGGQPAERCRQSSAAESRGGKFPGARLCVSPRRWSSRRRDSGRNDRARVQAESVDDGDRASVRDRSR